MQGFSDLVKASFSRGLAVVLTFSSRGATSPLLKALALRFKVPFDLHETTGILRKCKPSRETVYTRASDHWAWTSQFEPTRWKGPFLHLRHECRFPPDIMGLMLFSTHNWLTLSLYVRVAGPLGACRGVDEPGGAGVGL